MSESVPFYAFTVIPSANFSGFRYMGKTNFDDAMKNRGPDDMLILEGKSVDTLLATFQDMRMRDRLFLFEIESSTRADGGGWCLIPLPPEASQMSRQQLYEECVPRHQRFMKHLLISVYSATEGQHIFRKHNVH